MAMDALAQRGVMGGLIVLSCEPFMISRFDDVRSVSSELCGLLEIVSVGNQGTCVQAVALCAPSRIRTFLSIRRDAFSAGVYQ